VIVAGDGEHAAVPRRAGGIAVLERIARAVDARTLAVPEAEDPVAARARKQVRLLRAPDRRRGEVLVEPGLELDPGGRERRSGAPELAVEPTERMTSTSAIKCFSQVGASYQKAPEIISRSSSLSTSKTAHELKVDWILITCSLNLSRYESF
jgi:hypothetical protein